MLFIFILVLLLNAVKRYFSLYMVILDSTLCLVLFIFILVLFAQSFEALFLSLYGYIRLYFGSSAVYLYPGVVCSML